MVVLGGLSIFIMRVEYACIRTGVQLVSRALGLWLSAHMSCRSVYLSANNMISTVCSCIDV